MAGETGRGTFQMHKRLTAAITFLTALFVPNAIAQTQPAGDSSTVVKTGADGRIYVVYDSSGSMWGELADKSRKYEAGRTALSTFLETDLGGREVAFRAYGHREKADCRDSELIVPFSPLDVAKPKINDAVANIRPMGKTPINYSLREASKDFDGHAQATYC